MSYSNLPASIVIRACEGYLQAREARIQRECEELIAGSIGHRGWFGFGKPTTREQAEAECAEEIGLIRITGGRWARDVADLLSLARLSQKRRVPVAVKAELAPLLEKHFN
jgi:hypothetical protein